MEPTNPTTSPVNPISPQPLSADVAKPTEMPMGVPMQPAGGQSLPADLPPTGVVKSPGGSKKMIMMVLILVVIIVLLGVGGYYFWSMQNTEPAQQESIQVVDDPDLRQLQTETSEIELSDPQEEITQISSEIKLLEATPSASASSSARPR